MPISRKKKEAEAAAAAQAAQTAAQETVQETAEETVAADVQAEAPAAEAAEPAAAEPVADKSDEAVQKLEAELAELKDQHLRLMAEYDNFRKRTSREKLSLSADIKADCVTALLPVIDNIERALASGSADAEALRRGVEMIYDQTRGIFERMEVTAFGEAGDVFDPQLHNCVSTTEASEQFAADQITLVMQKGYMLGDKVIRPAMVQVAN